MGGGYCRAPGCPPNLDTCQGWGHGECSPRLTCTASSIPQGSEGQFTFDITRCPAFCFGPLSYLAMGCEP